MIDNTTQLIQIPRPTNADDVRRCAVALGMWAIGLDAGPQKIFRLLQLYGSGISAYDVRDKRWSGCGVTGEGIHRLLRVDADCLYEPYFPAALQNPKRMAVVRAQIYLKAMGAWQTPSADDTEPRPQPGAYVVQGCGLPGEAYGGTPHVGTLLRWDGDVVVFSEGGQRGVHGEQIEEVRRRWEVHNGRVRLVDLRNGKWRHVLGWGDVDLMRFRDGPVTVPVGWEDVVV